MPRRGDRIVHQHSDQRSQLDRVVQILEAARLVALAVVDAFQIGDRVRLSADVRLLQYQVWI